MTAADYEGHLVKDLVSSEQWTQLEDIYPRIFGGDEVARDFEVAGTTVQTRYVPVCAYADEEISHILAMSIDVTVEREKNSRLAAGKAIDTLTGLPRRALLEAHIAGDIRYGRPFSVFFLDLDRFKFVNDTYGHATGDRLLQQVGTALRKIIREGDIVVRLGGDEFVVAMRDVPQPEKTALRVAEVVEAVARTYSAGCSVGVASYPSDGSTLTELLEVADRVMYAAKRIRRPVAS